MNAAKLFGGKRSIRMGHIRAIIGGLNARRLNPDGFKIGRFSVERSHIDGQKLTLEARDPKHFADTLTKDRPRCEAWNIDNALRDGDDSNLLPNFHLHPRRSILLIPAGAAIESFRVPIRDNALSNAFEQYFAYELSLNAEPRRCGHISAFLRIEQSLLRMVLGHRRKASESLSSSRWRGNGRF